MPGRAPKRKGDCFERDCVNAFNAYGFTGDGDGGKVSRVSLRSQAGKSFVCDITVRIMGALRRIECKRRKCSFKTLYKALKGNWAALLRDDDEQCLIVMRFSDFLPLAEAAAYGMHNVNLVRDADGSDRKRLEDNLPAETGHDCD